MLIWNDTSCQWQNIELFWNSDDNCQAWNDIECYWNKIYSYWNDIELLCIEIQEEIVDTGGRVSDEDLYNAYDKLDKEKKRKLIRIILYINNIKIDRRNYIDLDKYKITVEDIKNIMDIYNDNKKEIQINVSDILVR